MLFQGITKVNPLLIGFFIGGMLVVYWFMAGRKIKTLEFRVVVLGLASTAFMVVLSQNIDPNNPLIFITMILIGVPFMIFSGWYNIRTIKRKTRQLKNLVDNVINASSEMTINVANVATELAASVSEVNATSEEISSDTQKIAYESQDVVISTDYIHEIFLIITSIFPPDLITVFFDSSANFRTSSATTAKPRPFTPALPASILAFSASKLV